MVGTRTYLFYFFREQLELLFCWNSNTDDVVSLRGGVVVTVVVSAVVVVSRVLVISVLDCDVDSVQINVLQIVLLCSVCDGGLGSCLSCF